MASIAAALTGPATSKSGRPIERLIGSFIDFDMSNALRIPEASILLIRSAIQASFTVRAPGSSHAPRVGQRLEKADCIMTVGRTKRLGGVAKDGCNRVS